MELLDQITVPREQPDVPPAVVQLLQGDLSAIPREHAVDLLIVSAFPDSYTPNPGTLFESLYSRGLDLRELARIKSVDERTHLGCWLSRSLPPTLAQRFHFRRILCFEPRFPAFLERVDSRELGISGQVGQVFRCLNNYAIPETHPTEARRDRSIQRVALPLLATGNQGEPITRMLPQLLESATLWLRRGLPIQQLKIVAFHDDDAATAKTVFEEFRQQSSKAPATTQPHTETRRETIPSPPPISYPQQLAVALVDTCRRELERELIQTAEPSERTILERVLTRWKQNAAPSPVPTPAPTEPPPSSTPVIPAPSPDSYDLFVSYAHKQDAEVAAFVDALRAAAPTLRIFYDRSSIAVGAQWIQTISDAVQYSQRFVAILSPDYSASPVCWDEFQCAKLKEYTTRKKVIKTIRLYREPDLPPIMGIHSYDDCVEGDLVKLRTAAVRLATSPST